tara:strand:- start:2136 stop:2972 length:837 start_codon:yes stop_codon:yes gene_type:complete
MDVLKTIKMYVGGSFIRSESGATVDYKVSGEELARVCWASKKDFRNAVTAAQSGQKSWASKTAYNRSQILYRMGEMAQGKETELINLLLETELCSEDEVAIIVQDMIDTFVYYAGWCDKYQQVMGSVNPVAAPYHNFTSPEALGVVSLISSKKFDPVGLIDNICSILVGGNSVIALVEKEGSILLSVLAEIFHTSDLPGGVVNLLSGDPKALGQVVSEHMEVQGLSFQNEDQALYYQMRSSSVDNMKRVVGYHPGRKMSLESVLEFVEQKTVWHPIGV